MKDKVLGEAVAFARLTKIDEKNRMVYGRITQEYPDRQGEIMDYASSKPLFEAWSKSQLEASLGKSAGNVRGMHNPVGAGIIPPGQLTFHDDERAIDIGAHVVDDAEWEKCVKGVYTGFSVGGSYAKKWKDEANAGLVRYTARPGEVSLVDRPAVPTATFFEMTKRDGTTVKVEFQKPVMYKVAHRGGEDAGAEIDSRDVPEIGGDFEIGDRKFLLLKRDDAKKTLEVDLVYEVTGSTEEIGAFAKALGERGVGVAQATALLVAGLPLAPTAQAVEARAMADAKALKFDWVAKGDEADKRRGEIRKSARAALEAEALDLLKKANQDRAVEAKARELCKAAGKNPDDGIQVEGKPETREALWKGFVPAATEALAKGAPAPAQTPAVILLVDGLPAALDLAGLCKRHVVKVFADEAGSKYPIDTGDQVKAAHAYFSLAAGNYPAEVAKAIRGRIDAAAKEKGVKLEEVTAKAMTAGELRKGMWSVSSLANLIDGLCGLADSCEYEAMVEGDGSGIAGELRAAVTMLGAILQRMAAEEVAEAAKTGAASAVVLAAAERLGGLVKRLLPPAQPEKPTAEAIEALALSKLEKVGVDKASPQGQDLLVPLRKAAELELQGQAREALAKAASHTAVSNKHIQKVHDVACKMGATCSDGEDDVEKVEKRILDSLVKAGKPEAEAKALAKALAPGFVGTSLAKRAPEQLPAPAGDLKKAVDEALAPVQAELKKALERVKALEDQPMPSKVQLAILKTVGKEADTNLNLTKGAGEFTAVLDGKGEVDVAATLIKAQQTPGGMEGLQKILGQAAKA